MGKAGGKRRLAVHRNPVHGKVTRTGDTRRSGEYDRDQRPNK
jgi:hypothetical protein